MKAETTYYKDLITKYLYGEASPQEIGELDLWVKEDPANASIFTDLHQAWLASERHRMDTALDVDQEWTRLISRISEKQPRIGTEVHDHQKISPDRGSVLKSSAMQLTGRGWWRVAAAIVVIAVPLFFLYRYMKTPVECHLAAVTGMVEKVLPDGTLVILKDGSTLTYPSEFSGSFRNVTLQGEGWFEVAHNKSKPFIVSSEEARIRVVGTRFFVDTREPDGSKEVILDEGLVSVYFEHKHNGSTILIPGEKATLTTETGTIVRSVNDDVNYLSWKTKRFVFNNTPLTDVVALLTEVYHQPVTITGGAAGSCRITATFDKQTLESILNVLKATLDLQITPAGNGFEISGKGCSQGK